MSEPNSSVRTTSLPVESTEGTVTLPDYGPKKREAEHTASNEYAFSRQNLIVGKSDSKEKFSHSSQFPRVAIPWIGEVEDA